MANCCMTLAAVRELDTSWSNCQPSMTKSWIVGLLWKQTSCHSLNVRPWPVAPEISVYCQLSKAYQILHFRRPVRRMASLFSVIWQRFAPLECECSPLRSMVILTSVPNGTRKTKALVLSFYSWKRLRLHNTFQITFGFSKKLKCIGRDRWPNFHSRTSNE